MEEKTKFDKDLSQLGLPPMELAESNRNGQSTKSLKKCSSSVIQKLTTILALIMITAASYMLLINILQTFGDTHTTEIVILTETPNDTLEHQNVKIIVQLNNKTSHSKTMRKKRHVNQFKTGDATYEGYTVHNIKKSREIVMNHNEECYPGNENEICKDLVSKLKNVIGNNDNSTDKNIQSNALKKISSSATEHDSISTEKFKRETFPSTTFAMARPTPHAHFQAKESYGHSQDIPVPELYPQSISAPQITDTCLLAKLLKHSYPQVQSVFDASPPAYLPSNYENHQSPYSRYAPSAIPPSYLLNRGVETDAPKRKMHPQDVEIFMKFLTPKPTNLNTNSSTREANNCASDTLPCDNGDSCISRNKWCDGNVDCSDVSDESRCSCKERVDKSRLCDGYFDCPFGEDELGCFGCVDLTFSCEDLDINSQSTCFTEEQRCNNIADCPNSKDETDCTMLAPSLHKKPLFAVSNTEGFLQRNYRGHWYPVCQNPYMWAHEACRRETGLIIRPPFIQMIQIDPTEKVNYINTGPGGMAQISNTCYNSSAMYVTCPDLLCGTRVLSTAQILRENAAVENHLFGRNKRFLLNRKLYPYPIAYYSNRKRRHTLNMTHFERDQNARFASSEINFGEYFLDNILRHKRTESRVVGGKPSQPAAWPWVVAMYRDGMFHCGGVILTQSWVLSAAHCVHKFWEHYYEIQVGMLRRFSFSPQEQNHRVSHIIVNQHYNQEDMKNDLSLLKVKRSIQFSRWVRPICLPGSETAGPDWLRGPPAGTVCTAVGWGATIEHGPDPDHMREVEVPVWDHCKHREDQAGKEICAGLVEGGKDACQGDSGGPLLCRNPSNPQQWYMAGIVSHGDGCARKGEPGVYTRVSIFVRWIKYHIFSKSLPTIEPKQECPGFKCASGILKCLPDKRMCDKIVDCLDGEDELNCPMKSANTFNNIFLNAPQIFETKEAESNSQTIKTDDNRRTKDDVDLIVKGEINKERKNEDLSLDSSNIHEAKTAEIDFTQASTLEIHNSRNTEETQTGSIEEDSTMLTTNEDMGRETRGDMQSFTVALSKETLESRSSILENKEQTKAANIEEDWADVTNTSPQHIESIISTETKHHDHITTETAILNNEHAQSNTQDTINNEDDQNQHLSTLINSHDSNVESKNLLIDIESNTHSALAQSDDEATLTSTNETPSKSLPDAEIKNKLIDDIKDIVQPTVERAKLRNKLQQPKEFICGRINQVVPYHLRCDHKADCEDGTDELDCSCSDYLSRFEKSLLCDGIFDCADGQDEIDCFGCPEEHFLCAKSQLCLPMKNVCDGKPQCPQGEDELDCFTLSNGRNLVYDFDGRPKITLEGFLTKKHAKDWHVVCENNLSTEQQELAASHICRYLGFSSANRYLVKHINIKEDEILQPSIEDFRNRREIDEVPVQFAFRKVDEDSARHIVLKEPEFLKEKCVPNVTKTCQSLYVYCDHSLFSDIDLSDDLYYTRAAEITNHMWPWIAKVYVDGDYKCSGVLVELSLVLVSHSCLWDTLFNHHHLTVIVGSHRTLTATNGMFEQIKKVDAKKDLFHSKAVLLHLKEPMEYSTMVKPMITHISQVQDEKPQFCVAIGQNENNSTVGVFLQETSENCDLSSRCYSRLQKEKICFPGVETNRHWAGIISCHSEQGWYPAASFVDSRGECGLEDRIIATEIRNLRSEIKHTSLESITSSMEMSDLCESHRCGRGRCLKLKQVCDEIKDCEDGSDEFQDVCEHKRTFCTRNPYSKGCECSKSELKCHNGKCVPKNLFRNGKDDCGDGTDEPIQDTCSHYLARVAPSRLCDGILHCADRSDEDPMFCKCFAKRTYKCSKSSSDVEHCVAPDMVCDGVRDCPNGEDEQACIGLSAPEGTTYGTGQVIVRQKGVWYSKCYLTENHTRTELEAICKELGFISGHAKQLHPAQSSGRIYNSLVFDDFSEVLLNNKTSIKLRNTDAPLARAIVDETLDNCFSVFIECL